MTTSKRPIKCVTSHLHFTKLAAVTHDVMSYFMPKAIATRKQKTPSQPQQPTLSKQALDNVSLTSCVTACVWAVDCVFPH